MRGLCGLFIASQEQFFLVQSLREDTPLWYISWSICDEWCGSLYTDVYTVLVNCNYLLCFEAAAAWQRSAKWLLFFRDSVNTDFYRTGEICHESIPKRFCCKKRKMKLSSLLVVPFQPLVLHQTQVPLAWCGGRWISAQNVAQMSQRRDILHISSPPVPCLIQLPSASSKCYFL